MAQPVLGKDAVIQFLKGDDYFPYACATDIAINFEMETKSVKTIGDGNWEKVRGQKKGYSIDLNGLIKFDDDTVPHAFDIYDYFHNMTAIPYRIIFTNDEGDLKVVEGNALPTSVGLGGGSEGFATGSATLKGDGAVEVRDLIIPCPSSIQSIQLVEGGDYPLIRITAHTGTPARYEYSIDGGGFVTQMATSYIQDLVLDPGIAAGSHTITIIPVCENGENGTPYEATFEIIGTGGGGCDVPTDIVFTLITEDSATASWTPPGTPPGDGYQWELYAGLSFVDGDTEAGTSVNLTGLTGGVEYTFKVKSICTSGVAESVFTSDTFTTDAPTDPTQVQWQFQELSGGNGTLTISKNGSNEVTATITSDGVFAPAGGDSIAILVIGPGAQVKDLFVYDLTAGITLYSDTGTGTQGFIFTATANHIYQVTANIYG
jgi:hypothetical protein